MIAARDVIDLILGVLSAIGAMMAAKVWLEASLLKFPPHTADSYDGKGPFSETLKRQSELNASAAMWAAGAALCQTLALSIKVILAFWDKLPAR
jgi:hypothetical protein